MPETRGPEPPGAPPGTVPGSPKEQVRWDGYGQDYVEAIRAEPSRFIVGRSPLARFSEEGDIMRALGDLAGARVLELGAGRGNLSVYLAKQGARVTGVDIGPNLVEAARLLASVNDVAARFVRADITDLPFEDGSFDRVVGIAILHHLPEEGLARAVCEAHRVLAPGGVGVFKEPVENSRVFSFLQDLVPAGRKGTSQYRPSILMRRAWRDYVASLEDRAVTTAELVGAGEDFERVVVIPHGLVVRLERILGSRQRQRLMAVDRRLMGLPFMARLSQTVVVEYRKRAGSSGRSGGATARVG